MTAAVELCDIVTEDDVEAVMGLRVGPGQERLRYGFERTGEVTWGQDLLRLDLAARRDRSNGGRA